MRDTTLLPGESSADACRRLGFGVGTRLIGNEGYGNTVIEITAVGQQYILAKQISHNGVEREYREGYWTLGCRMWRRVERSGI